MRPALSILFVCSFSIVSCSPKQQEKEPPKPNILFIAVDDLRPELNFYGESHIKSPNLDKLARESLVFNRAYCNVPVCGASRASLLTGARPTRFRYIDAQTSKDHDYPDAITEFIDIYPSLCELTGIQIPETVEGKSFVPVIKGEKSDKDYAVSKFKDAVTLIKGNLFYTEWTNDEGTAYARMLFDHSTDPLELDNLSEKKEYRETVLQLSAELREKWGEDFMVKQ